MFVSMLCLLVFCTLFAVFLNNDNAMTSSEGGEGVRGAGENGSSRARVNRGPRGKREGGEHSGAAEACSAKARAYRGAQL